MSARGACEAEGNPFHVGRFHPDVFPKFRCCARNIVPTFADQKKFDPRVLPESLVIGRYLCIYREDVDEKFVGQLAGQPGRVQVGVAILERASGRILILRCGFKGAGCGVAVTLDAMRHGRHMLRRRYAQTSTVLVDLVHEQLCKYSLVGGLGKRVLRLLGICEYRVQVATRMAVLYC